jgi:2,3-bisphosphoglycerate-dependent phosphoglycerate mutase
MMGANLIEFALETSCYIEEKVLIHRNFRCEFYFIRHGESESNATPGFAAGVNFDAPLTEKGCQQARLLGQRLKREGVRFDRVYSSSLKRPIQTTETFLKEMGEEGREFPRVEAIIEQQIPGWRGVPSADVMTSEMISYMRGKGAHFVPPEGESFHMVERRMSGWIEDEIIYNQEMASKPLSLTVAIVGHGQATRCLMHYIMGFDERFLDCIRLDNTSICRFQFDYQGWYPICINDSSHLRDGTLAGESAITP